MSSKLTFGEAVAAFGGLILFVALFFDWYAAERGGGANAISAWQAFSAIDIALLLVAAVPVTQAALVLSGRSARLPDHAGSVIAAVGAVGVLLVGFRVIELPDGLAAYAPEGPFVGETAAEVGRRIGGFLALLATAAIAGGGWTGRIERVPTA